MDAHLRGAGVHNNVNQQSAAELNSSYSHIYTNNTCLHITVYSCGIHNTTPNSFGNLKSHLLDNNSSSVVVYWREEYFVWERLLAFALLSRIT